MSPASVCLIRTHIVLPVTLGDKIGDNLPPPALPTAGGLRPVLELRCWLGLGGQRSVRHRQQALILVAVNTSLPWGVVVARGWVTQEQSTRRTLL